MVFGSESRQLNHKNSSNVQFIITEQWAPTNQFVENWLILKTEDQLASFFDTISYKFAIFLSVPNIIILYEWIVV